MAHERVRGLRLMYGLSSQAFDIASAGDDLCAACPDASKVLIECLIMSVSMIMCCLKYGVESLMCRCDTQVVSDGLGAFFTDC